MSFELRHLSAFLDVVNAGSFSIAASSTFTTQPTISRHVAALEKHLGAQLLLRTPTGVVPTAAGERLIPQAVAVLAAVQALNAPDNASSGCEMASGSSMAEVVPMAAGLLLAQRTHPTVEARRTASMS